MGEIDCPTPKGFNSPLTQNPFCILERILSYAWFLDATFSNWPQVSSMFKQKSYFENQYIGLRFSIVDQKAPDALQKNTHQILKIPRVTPSPPCGSPAAAAEAMY